MLPFVFYPLHELFEALLAADVNEEGIVFHKKRIIDKTTFDSALYPISLWSLAIFEHGH